MTLKFDYDEATDIIIIEGIKYSGELFRAWGQDGVQTDTLFKIVRRYDGVLTIDIMEPVVTK